MAKSLYKETYATARAATFTKHFAKKLARKAKQDEKKLSAALVKDAAKAREVVGNILLRVE